MALFCLWIGHLGHELKSFNLRIGAARNQRHIGSVDWHPINGRAVWKTPHNCCDHLLQLVF